MDGIADLIHDVNDTIASPALILELRTLSIKYSCPVVCVLHENPSKEGGQNKTRGHLGSQLERKAFASLTLSKNADGVVSVFSGNSRKLHIAKEGAPSFVWSDDVGMHVTCTSASATASAAKALSTKVLMDELASKVFANVPADVGLNWEQVHEGIEKVGAAKSRSGARKKFDALRLAKSIQKIGQRYHP